MLPWAQHSVHSNQQALACTPLQHLVHPGARHVSLASLPGMADRCLRIGSAGKTFSFTAWKVRWPGACLYCWLVAGVWLAEPP